MGAVVEASDARRLYFRPTSLLVRRYWLPCYPILWEVNKRLARGELALDALDFGVWFYPIGAFSHESTGSMSWTSFGVWGNLENL